MKKAVCFALLFLVWLTAYTQQANTYPVYPLQDQNKKGAPNQLAWLITGGGVAVVATGVALHGSHKNYSSSEEIGTALIIAGSAAVLTGIVLFSTSAICRSGNNSIGMYLKVENANTLEQAGHQALINSRSYPALSLIFELQKE